MLSADAMKTELSNAVKDNFLARLEESHDVPSVILHSKALVDRIISVTSCYP
jgi:hypothetical protein